MAEVNRAQHIKEKMQWMKSFSFFHILTDDFFSCVFIVCLELISLFFAQNFVCLDL
jgi:hypothetical protein